MLPESTFFLCPSPDTRKPMSRSIPCGAGTPARETAGQFHSTRTQTMFIRHRLQAVILIQFMDTASRGQECPRHTFMFPTRTYQYRRRLPHFQKFDRPLFVTFCKLLHNHFSERARDLVLKHCIHDHGRRIDLHAAVIMPDHVHMLFTLLRDERGWPYPMQKILKMIKGTSARDINRLLGSSGPVWQAESFDHVLRSQESLEEKIEYIRMNPVRAALVRQPEEYRWLWLKP